jgi:hypothetical protein
MSLRSKLTIGLGFLFLIIFGLTIYSSYQIQKLSREANTILKDNYDSLVYCKNMLLALDDMSMTVNKRVFGLNPNKASGYDSQLFEGSRSTFESNQNAENHNITEVHEREYVGELNDDYRQFLNLCLKVNEKGANPPQYLSDFLPSYEKVRQTIVKINDLNMEAVERKSQSTRNDADAMIISMAVSGTICIMLAFFYFWYFPFYISNTFSYLAKKMKAFLQNVGVKIDTKTDDEAFVILHSIDLLENKFGKTKPTKK